VASSPPRPDAGYASAVAMTVILAVSLVVSAMMARNVAALRQARTDFDRTRAAYALAGAQQRAAIRMLERGDGDRLSWAETSDVGSVSILAEREDAKASLQTAATAPASTWEHLSLRDAGSLSLRLEQAAGRPLNPAQLEAMDASPLWRACAASVVSGFGRGGVVALPPAGSPTGAATAHLGEAWRLRASVDGFADDRIVRFSGRKEHAAAVVWRRFYRLNDMGGKCESAFARPTA